MRDLELTIDYTLECGRTVFVDIYMYPSGHWHLKAYVAHKELPPGTPEEISKGDAGV